MSDATIDQGKSVSGTKISLDRRFYLAAWRWHFYAGLFVIPFFLILAVSGMMMMFIGYFDGRDGDRIAVAVPQGSVSLPLEIQVHKAEAVVEGGSAVEWIHPPSADRASVFRVAAADGSQQMIGLDPYTGELLDRWERRKGWYDFADNLHGELLIGTFGDRLIEVAAGFGFVLVITGLYLWWPRDRPFWTGFIPRLRGNIRNIFKELHVSIGVYVSLFLVLFLLSGMSWTGVWGGKIVQAWNTFPAEKWNNVPLSDETHAAMNHGSVSDVPWALEQTQLPLSGSDAGLDGVLDGEPINLASIDSLAERLGFSERYRIAFPRGEDGVWTINQDTMSADASDPFNDRTVHIDRYTGKVLANVGFADYSLAGKTMAVSIPLHMGLVGLWNLILNTFICLMVIGLCISGVIMWWLRRPSTACLRLLAPRLPEGMPHWRNAMIVMLCLSLFFPLVGLTLIVVLLLDVFVVQRVTLLKKVFA